MTGAASASADVLPDGTPLFGNVAEVAYDPDEDRVQCHLCGKWFRRLGGSHLRRTHGWTLAHCRDAFQLPLRKPLCARSLSSTMCAGAQARIGRNGFGLGGPLRRGTTQERVRPWRSLAAVAPGLLAELHATRNPELDPTGVAAAANRRVGGAAGPAAASGAP
jgi:hypothetical protein